MAAPPSPELHLHHLCAIQVLGNGAMGTVFLVYNHLTDPSANCPFALKVVEKLCPQAKLDADRRARWEVSVLEGLNQKPHPFLPSLIGAFETEEILAWAIPFCPGGDLNVLRHRQMDRVFSPAVIRFYLAEIVCALQHLHSMGIVYRDLKPENILIQHSGHVTLTDFDLSRTLAPKSLKSLILSSSELPEIQPEVNKHHRKLTRLFPMMGREKTHVKLKKAKSARVSPMTRKNASFSNGERSNSFVGTEEYVAPEVVRGDGHEFAVDWWALGILSYEMLYGTTPFRGKNRKDTFGRILMLPPKFTGKPTPLTDLITKLLAKEPTQRLGYTGGACEIQEHPFFSGLQWELLTEVLRPPFLPSRDDLELTPNPDGINITEYFQKLRQLPSPLDSPSRDDCGYNVSLTEF
ncbi:serine/threonine-protein kinase UCN [Cynara cardunculus var. scolymus]|uniref:non-specific serine/threonine protein kinase n=1 Tax=Cynara cardunculus var. scolymus TaxID=59895 RepID=A0A103XHM1_CYNCS|nr:serine/threonine-protein kinase UCN [Cynara cardunculus var. scolymus]KVH90824.1 Protein kinase, ATP binding site-containing protein [Cynara cardunculus var. scolymus]